MKFLKRLKNLPFESLLFFLFLSYLFFELYRFVYPVPKDWFYPGFLIQFSLTFFAQLYARKWGRIFTALGAILLARVSWIAEPSLPYHLANNVGLFLGSISGIWMREILMVVLGRSEIILPKQSDRFLTQWMIRNPSAMSQGSIFFQTPFYLLFWCLILLLTAFISLFGFSTFYGLKIPEFMYLPGLSSREAFAFPVGFAVSICLPILYFFSEERSSPVFSKEAILSHLFFGVFVGLFVQIVVILIQFFLLPGFFAAGTGDSLLTGRNPGLFIDSGSSSWILPSLSAVWILVSHQRYKQTKERFTFLWILFLIFLVSMLGARQGKTFWFVWLGFLSVWIVIAVTSHWISDNKKLWTARAGLFVLIPLLCGSFLWGVSKMDSHSSLVTLGKKYSEFQSEFFKTKSLSSLRAIDENRYELTLITWEGFRENIWLGNGFASLPVALKDADKKGTKLSNQKLIDLAPNFYLGVLYDLGIFGSLLLFLLVGLLVWERGTYAGLFLCAIPFLFGMQMQHSDGAFLVVLLLLYPVLPMNFGDKTKRNSNWFRYTILILSIGLPLHYMILFSQRMMGTGIGSEFRKEVFGNYQLQASVPFVNGTNSHEFHGKGWEWKITSESFSKTGKFRADSKNEKLQTELLWFNDRRLPISKVLVPWKGSVYEWNGSIPDGAQYVRLVTSSRSELTISQSQFDRENRFRLVR